MYSTVTLKTYMHKQICACTCTFYILKQECMVTDLTQDTELLYITLVYSYTAQIDYYTPIRSYLQ